MARLLNDEQVDELVEALKLVPLDEAGNPSPTSVGDCYVDIAYVGENPVIEGTLKLTVSRGDVGVVTDLPAKSGVWDDDQWLSLRNALRAVPEPGSIPEEGRPTLD